MATAKLFVEEGAYVFITGRRQKELDDAVTAIGTSVSGVQGDVESVLRPHIDLIRSQEGGIHGQA